MASISIKNVPEDVLKRLKARAKRQHRSLAQEILHILSLKVKKPKKLHSILELRGLGKDTWKGIDPAKYISELRDEWD